MPGYIQAIDLLFTQGRYIVGPPEAEIQKALAFLTHNPVVGYVGFTEDEVRLIALYRAHLNQGAYDIFWQSMLGGYAEGWVFAVHEAAEIQSFEAKSINPFSDRERTLYFAEAHLLATLAELRYLQAWAEQLNLNISEIALEMENPFRKQFPGHKHFINSLQLRQNWTDATPLETAIARQFWEQIMREEIL